MAVKELLLVSLGQHERDGWLVDTYSFVAPAKGTLRVTTSFSSRRDGESVPTADLGVDALGQQFFGVADSNWGHGNVTDLRIDKAFDYEVGGTPVTVAVKRRNENATQTGYSCKVVYSYEAG